MKHVCSLRRLGAVVSALALVGSAQAAQWNWNASSGKLPSQAGAIARVATGSASDTLLPGGPLRLNSGEDAEWMYYMSIGNQLDMPDQLDMSFTARYVEGHSASPWRSPLMVAANLVGGRGVTIVISDTAVSILRYDDAGFSSSYALDTLQYHDYRLAISGPENGAPVDLYVDGVKRLRDNVSQGSLYTPHARIFFGDGTWGASGSSEWLSFSHNAAVVPEPGTWALMLCGLGLLAGSRRVGRSHAAAAG